LEFLIRGAAIRQEFDNIFAVSVPRVKENQTKQKKNNYFLLDSKYWKNVSG